MRCLLGGVLGTVLVVLAGCASNPPAPSPAAVAPGQQATVVATGQQQAAIAASSTPTLVIASPTSTLAASPTGSAPVATPRRTVVATSATPTRQAVPAQVPPASGPLVLAVDEPAADAVEVPAAARTLAVAGRTSPDAVLSINGRLVQPDAAGAFRANVPLDADMTLVEIIASDASGQELRQQVVAVRE
jgi:hypothetical protein